MGRDVAGVVVVGVGVGVLIYGMNHREARRLSICVPLHDRLRARVVLVDEEERLVPVLHEGLAEPHNVGVLWSGGWVVIHVVGSGVSQPPIHSTSNVDTYTQGGPPKPTWIRRQVSTAAATILGVVRAPSKRRRA